MHTPLRQKAKINYLCQVRLIGERLYMLRKQKKESLRTVGKAIGVSHGTISKMEKGTSNFHMTRLIALCKYYGISVSAIFDDDFTIAADFR